MIAKTSELLALALTFAAAHAFAATATVDIEDFQFAPHTVTINVGDAVQWANRGARPHTSTSDGGLWDSGNLTTGQSFNRVFNSAGTFNYHCTVHPSMTASVVVQSQAANPVPTQTGLGLNGSVLNIALNAGDNQGKNADWWLVAMAPWGHWYAYAYPNTWTDIGVDLSLLKPAYQGPLTNLANFALFDTKGIPSGRYVIYFGVDTNSNGQLDYGQLYYSDFTLNVP